jgi:hypothetical protein
MKRWLSRWTTFVAILVCAITLIADQSPPQRVPWVTPTEVYDPSLGGIQTVDQVVAALDRSPSMSTTGRVHELEQLLRARFYHGYARYSLHENWVAWLAARLVHPDLDAKVDPAEILRHPWAACSQQAMVVQEVLKRMNLDYASVIFPGHFASAVRIAGIWYVVDPWGPLKRDRSRLIPLSEWQSEVARANVLTPAERRTWDPLLDKQAPRLAYINQDPAPTMSWFHPLTKFLSKWLWIPALLWLIAVFSRRRSAARRQKIGGVFGLLRV